MEENKFSDQPPQYGQNQNQNQNQNFNQPMNNQFGQIPVPNSAAVLVLGILSIVLCACAGIVGLILGIIALVLANKALPIYNANKANYTLSSFNNLKAGKICAIIGTILSSLYFIYYLILVCIIGAAAMSTPWGMMK